MSAIDELIDQFADTVIHLDTCARLSRGTRLGIRCDCGMLDEMVSPARAELAALREEIARLRAKVEKAEALAGAFEGISMVESGAGWQLIGMGAARSALAAYRGAP